ncbi:MAG: sterol desaturase family protein [Archangium sp.]|nr:sterol desaturase family protein [Archangium sp.]
MDINVYAVVTPFVLLLMLAEIAWCMYRKNGFYEFQDSIASLGTAIINQCVNVLVAFMWLPVLTWLYEHRLVDAPTGMLGAVVLFFGVDFLFYWFHRFGHRTNIGWAAHMPHHSTEELNYAVALRASVTQRFFSFFFYWPLCLLGFGPKEMAAMVAFHLVLQLIPHTRVVPKLPRFIESWMNTPSHHRVHHARNDAYLDKNYGGFLIIWDKLFGTFAPETEEASYGVTSPPNTWDPTFINFQVWKQVARDSWEAKSLFDKVRVWFMPTGWRPAGARVLPKTEWKRDGKEVKFQSTPLAGSKAYLVWQVALGFPAMLLVTRPDSPLDTVQKVVLSVLLWGAATAWSAMLESKRWALPFEALRCVAMGAFFAVVLAPWNTMAAVAGVALMSLNCFWLLVMGSRQPASSLSLGSQP